MTINTKYLELIQNIISRMADSSFRVKQWSLVTLAAAWGLLNRTEYIFHIFLGMCILACVFWYLSSFYLRCERMYRYIYDKVVSDFSEKSLMDFRLTPTAEERQRAGLLILVMIRPTELCFFMALLIANVFFAFSWEDICSLFQCGKCCCCPCY